VLIIFNYIAVSNIAVQKLFLFILPAPLIQWHTFCMQLDAESALFKKFLCLQVWMSFQVWGSCTEWWLRLYKGAHGGSEVEKC